MDLWDACVLYFDCKLTPDELEAVSFQAHEHSQRLVQQQQLAQQPAQQLEADEQLAQQPAQQLEADEQLAVQPKPAKRVKPAYVVRSCALRLEEVTAVRHLPIEVAARKLGCGTTLLKNWNKKFGFRRWPYRSLKAIRRLNEDCARFLPNDAEALECVERAKQTGKVDDELRALMNRMSNIRKRDQTSSRARTISTASRTAGL